MEWGTFLIILAVIAGISHILNIAEKAHKYGPSLVRKVAPYASSFIRPASQKLRLIWATLVRGSNSYPVKRNFPIWRTALSSFIVFSLVWFGAVNSTDERIIKSPDLTSNYEPIKFKEQVTTNYISRDEHESNLIVKVDNKPVPEIMNEMKITIGGDCGCIKEVPPEKSINRKRKKQRAYIIEPCISPQSLS